MYATNTPRLHPVGLHVGPAGHAPPPRRASRIALMRAVCGNLDVPGGDGMPGPALNYLTDEEMEANECLPEEQKAKQIGSDKFKLTELAGLSAHFRQCAPHLGQDAADRVVLRGPRPERVQGHHHRRPLPGSRAHRERHQPDQLLRRFEDDASGFEAVRVPRDGRLLDDAHGAAFRLRVPGGRRAGAPHHRDALRRHRFHPRRQARHAASRTTATPT